MPRIYESRVGLNAQLKYIPDDSLQQLGSALQGLAQAQQEKDYSIDMSEFAMRRAKDLEEIQNTASHDTTLRKDMIAGNPIEGNLVEYGMKKFDEDAYALEKKYGQRAKEQIAQYRVSNFQKLTNDYTRVKSTADLDWADDLNNDLSDKVKKGVISLEDAQTTAMQSIDGLWLSPEQRSAATTAATDSIYGADFNRLLSSNPLKAIDNLDSGYYNTASARAIQVMNSELDRKIQSDAMAEIQRANQATQDTFVHRPDPTLVQMAKKRNLPDVYNALASSYAMNQRINAVTSGDLQQAKAQAANEYLLAHQTENSAMKQDAEMKMKFIQQREALVYANPDLVALQEGLEVPDYDPSNPAELVAARRDIRKAVSDRQNSKVSLFGKDTDMLVQGIKQLPNDQRPGFLTSITSLLTGLERKDAIRELGSVDPLVGVAISVTPQNALPSREDTLLMGDILGDAPVEFKPKDSEYLPDVSAYFSGVNVGDPAVIEHYKKAAVNVYARQAQRNGWDSYSSKDMNKILEQIAGPTIEFGDNKTAGFKTKTGQWADPDLASSALENALELGVVKATTPEGEDIAGSQILDYGALVPSGENGVYYVRRSDGKYFNDESGQNPLLVNMNDIYTTDKSSRMGGFDAWKLSR